MKHMIVKIAGSDREPVDIEIDEGATAGEILSAVDLEASLLTYATRYFSTEEDVYAQVSDGDRLYALTNQTVC